MEGLAKFNFNLKQLYPEVGRFRINTCGNPDCGNFGRPPRHPRVKLPKKKEEERCSTARALLHAPGAYKISGADKAEKRITKAFEYQDEPHEWADQRTIRCKAALRNGTICNSGFSILSEDHLEEEVDRLRNHNGVLDGPACGCCGRRYLEAPEEFVLNGVHQRTKDRRGARIVNTGAPKSVRVVHRPCKGQRGARITISIPHARQKETKDNLRILHALLNSAGIVDAHRMLGPKAIGRSIGISRIYDRIAWLEQVFLAYEREMLRRWREKVERAGRAPLHRLSHDDLVLTVNWETATDRRNTQLNCAITADANSGYVYRLDVDFDPRVAPIEAFRQSYLDENGLPKNLSKTYPGTKFKSAPRFSWQRPTGRLHEPQFFAACVNELRAFHHRARRRLPRATKEQREQRTLLKARVDGDIRIIRTIAEDWFGFTADKADLRGSFRGMTTRDTYTKAAHFALLKEMLPPGRIILTTEQEATLPTILPHVFEDEIRQGRFTWLAMSFNKSAKKPEIVEKVRSYRKGYRQFHEEGMYAGRFVPETPADEVSKAFIAELSS